MDLGGRRPRPERMDEPGLDPAAHRSALRGLARINAVSRAAATLWQAVGPVLARADGRTGPRRLLDLASGGGDVAVGLWRRARRAGLPVEIEGCDRSGEALAFARERASRAGARVRFFRHDLLRDGVPGGYDGYVCSLFLHHLDDRAARTLLRGMGAGRVLAVLDLERSAPGLWVARVGTRLLSRSAVVHHDGPLSVRNAFRGDELETLARAAGLAGARVRRCWPFRLLLRWERAAAGQSARERVGA